MGAFGTVITAVVLWQFASADWQFKSRTDLAPPHLNITIPASHEVEKGYLFVAPFAGFHGSTTGTGRGPRQGGPYIFQDDGELVWSGYTYYSVWSANFQTARWKGQDILFCFEGDHNPTYGHGHGHATILDQHYETLRELRAGNHKLMDMHEFHIINEETALIQVYQPVPGDLTPWGRGNGRGRGAKLEANQGNSRGPSQRGGRGRGRGRGRCRGSSDGEVDGVPISMTGMI